MKRTVFIECIAALLILLWMYAALSKLLIYNTHVAQLGRMPYVGSFASSLAWIIPSLEIVLALLLISARSRSIALWASLFLMSGFTLYLLFAIGTGSKLPCSCGGVISKLSWPGHLAFNTFFIMITAVALWMQYNPVNTAYKKQYV